MNDSSTRGRVAVISSDRLARANVSRSLLQGGYIVEAADSLAALPHDAEVDAVIANVASVDDATELALFAARSQVECVIACAGEDANEIELTLSRTRAAFVRVVPPSVLPRTLVALLAGAF